VTDPDLIE
jgi:hypothetical protein